jgi:type II secretory pathway component PulC
MKNAYLARLARLFAFRFRKNAGKSAPAEDRTQETPGTPGVSGAARAEGRIFRIWNGLLPLLLGLVFGWLCMVSLEVWLNGYNRRARPAAMVPVFSGTAETLETMNVSSFLTANPFKISPMPVIEDKSETASGDAPVPIVGSLATAVLRGTSPGFVAWMEDQGKLRLVPVGSSFDVYTLEEVSYTEAVFAKDDDHVVKELRYSKQSPAPRPAVASSRPSAGGKAGAASDVAQHVVAADPGTGEEGVIAQTLIASLMENPFDELKKVRLRPAAEEKGLQIQWINRDSILSQLGIQKNDVIRSINGIPLQNMLDITNSMNSLMNSERFDVEVTRGGTSTSLRYVVR